MCLWKENRNELGLFLYYFLDGVANNLVSSPVILLTFWITVGSFVASSTRFKVSTTVSTHLTCSKDRRRNAFCFVAKYVFISTFLTTLFGNATQFADHSNTDRISTSPAFPKSGHFQLSYVTCSLIKITTNLTTVFQWSRQQILSNYASQIKDSLFLSKDLYFLEMIGEAEVYPASKVHKVQGRINAR